MALGREQIYATLFEQLQQVLLYPVGPFKYMGRRPVPLGRLAGEQYPSLILVEMGEDYQRNVLYAPAKVILMVSAIIQNDDGVAPNELNVRALNDLADSVEDALQSYCTPTAQNILNGLVQQAWVEGRQVVITGSYPQRWSEQVMGIKLILPHSR